MIKAAKQYSAFYFMKRKRTRLWQRYGHERVLRSAIERAATIRYILDNPVNAGWSIGPANYPWLGSACYSVVELILQATPSD
ncbi:MAG: hypothetical protein ABI818_15770 [Acidobacteriota bacterium]